MELYLIRHAHAVDESEDPTRPLSARGRKQVRTLAKFLSRSGCLAPEEIWHSSLVRSRETAALLVTGLKLRVPLTAVSGLEPEDDPAKLARRLRGMTRPLALVGHEPHLSALATRLVGAPPGGGPCFVLKKCAVIALEGAGERWQVRWQLSPELLG